jgi:hypothetical protein
MFLVKPLGRTFLTEGTFDIALQVLKMDGVVTALRYRFNWFLAKTAKKSWFRQIPFPQ